MIPDSRRGAPARGHPGTAGAPRDRVGTAAIWLLCLSPVAVFGGIENRWGWPTLVVAALAVLFAIWTEARGRFPRWFSVALAALACWLVITALLGQEPVAQLLGRAPRYEGAIELVVLFGVGWAGARTLGPTAADQARTHATRAWAVAAVLLAGVALLETIGLRPLDTTLARPGSLMGNATDQGIIGAMFVAILGMRLIGHWRRTQEFDAWSAIGTAAGVVAVATSASRAGLLALLIAAISIGIRLVLASPRRRTAILVLSGSLALVVGAVMAVPLTRDRLLGISGFARQTIADRFYMWSDASELIGSHLWLGVGPNGFADAITAFHSDEWFGRAQVGAVLDSPHNIALQALAVAGIPGLVLAIAVIGGIVVQGVRSARTSAGAHRDMLLGALVAVPAAGVALLTHLTSPGILVPLALLSGVLVGVAPRSGPLGRPARITASALAGGVVVALLVFTVADMHLLQGRQNAQKGDLLAAESGFTNAQALRPWDADVSLAAAATLGAAVENGIAGAADSAEAWAERALRALPHSARASFVAGMVASVRGDYEAAQERLGRASALSPADPRIVHEYGVALLLGGDPGRAIPALERALQLSPDSEPSWTALRDACLQVGDSVCVERAEDALDE